MITHDIKIPLTSIIGFASMIYDVENNALHPRARDFAETIQCNGQKVLELIENYLTTCRVEAGTLKAEPNPVDLPQMVQEILEVTSIEARRHNRQFEVTTEGVPNAVRLDGVLVYRALSNLIQNAIKYTAKDGVIRIRVSLLKAEESGQHVPTILIEVTNPVEEAPPDGFGEQIFYRYQRFSWRQRRGGLWHRTLRRAGGGPGARRRRDLFGRRRQHGPVFRSPPLPRAGESVVVTGLPQAKALWARWGLDPVAGLYDGILIRWREGRMLAVERSPKPPADLPARRTVRKSPAYPPGLLNAHAHVDYSFLRGRLAGRAGFVEWLRGLLRATAEELGDCWRDPSPSRFPRRPPSRRRCGRGNDLRRHYRSIGTFQRLAWDGNRFGTPTCEESRLRSAWAAFSLTGVPIGSAGGTPTVRHYPILRRTKHDGSRGFRRTASTRSTPICSGRPPRGPVSAGYRWQFTWQSRRKRISY